MYEGLNVLLPYKDDNSVIPSDVIEIMDTLGIGMSGYQKQQFQLLLDVWMKYGWKNKGDPMVHKLFFLSNPFQHDMQYIKKKLVCKMDCDFCKLSGAENTCTEYLKRNKRFVLKKMKEMKNKESPSKKRKKLFMKRVREEKKMQLLIKSKMQDAKKKRLDQANSKTPKNNTSVAFTTSSFYPKKKSLKAIKDSKFHTVVKDKTNFVSSRRKLSYSSSEEEGEVFMRGPIKNPYVLDDISVVSSNYQSGDSDEMEDNSLDEEEEEEEEEELEQEEDEEEEEELEQEEEEEEEEELEQHPPVKCSKEFLRNRRKRLNAFSN